MTEEERAKEIEVLRHELNEFLRKDLPQQYMRAKGLVDSTVTLLSNFSFTIQLSTKEEHLKGVIKLEGYQVKSSKIYYKIPNRKEYQETQIVKSFPLGNLQRSHHILTDVAEVFGNLEYRNLQESSNMEYLLSKNEEMMVSLQNAIDLFVLPYSSIYSSFPHLSEKFVYSTMKHLQKKFDPPLKREIIIEINVFEGQLVVSYHQVKFSARKKVKEIKMRTKGRFVEIETEDSNKVGYVKRTYKTVVDIGYFLRSISNLAESVDILKRINDKIRIFSNYKI